MKLFKLRQLFFERRPRRDIARVDSFHAIRVPFRTAPAGALGIVRLVATDDAGHTASASATLRVCCVEWRPPERPSWRLYFPDFR